MDWLLFLSKGIFAIACIIAYILGAIDMEALTAIILFILGVNDIAIAYEIKKMEE